MRGAWSLQHMQSRRRSHHDVSHTHLCALACAEEDEEDSNKKQKMSGGPQPGPGQGYPGMMNQGPPPPMMGGPGGPQFMRPPVGFPRWVASLRAEQIGATRCSLQSWPSGWCGSGVVCDTRDLASWPQAALVLCIVCTQNDFLALYSL
jgi:hypothetical protein